MSTWQFILFFFEIHLLLSLNWGLEKKRGTERSVGLLYGTSRYPPGVEGRFTIKLMSLKQQYNNINTRNITLTCEKRIQHKNKTKCRWGEAGRLMFWEKENKGIRWIILPGLVIEPRIFRSIFGCLTARSTWISLVCTAGTLSSATRNTKGVFYVVN